MCGIAGKLELGGAIVPESLIKEMCDTLIHRGPDAEGVYVGPYIGLGERRLSIIDLSTQADPPLANEDNSIWIVFNGEIYNFLELRSELIEKGHTFRTKTDTEVVVHLYEQYGINCLQHLRGMFAFAIWDSKKRALFAARDRLGKKPFFYTKTATALVFASSIKAITADPRVSVIPNFPAIDSYLTRQYVPSPVTAFSGIFKLPAAHFLLCDASGKLEVHRYWAPPLAETTGTSEHEIQTELLRLLKEAVRLRLISDVPLGAFLSGGIDSGTVVALMAMESSKPVKTFSIGFEEDDFDETSYARKVAKTYGTDHHEFILRPSVVEVLPLLVQHYSEPFADSSAVPTYYVSKMARQHVTVALSGDGGDEDFGGYDHYQQALRWSAADFVPWPARKVVARFMEGMLDKLPYTNLTAKASRAWHMIGSQLPERYTTQISILKQQEKRTCYTPYFRSLLSGNGNSTHSASLPWNQSMDSLGWMIWHDQNFYLPDCLMVKTDIASMANSLEVRSPFLDHQLVEFAASIPSALKRSATGGKVILKRATQGLLPPEVLNKPKTGFGVPLSKWLRTDLRDMLQGTLLDHTCAKRSLFKQSFLRRMVEEHVSKKRDWSSRLWALLFLELWFREFID